MLPGWGTLGPPVGRRADRLVITQHLRTLRLSDSLIGFYDGRVPGQAFGSEPNWVDDGALSLGICSYALVDGADALVYDTHVSVEHAAFIRTAVEELGARRITVVLSHWHLDHVAGTEAFGDCEIVANAVTAELLTRHRAAIESGAQEGPPAISPLVLPTTTFEGATHIDVGRLRVELLQFDIHSRDATVLYLPAEGLLLAGDTVEDTVTYVSEPDGLDRHLADLRRMRGLPFDRLYPNHGDAAVIAAGGYGEPLIRATEEYLEGLLRHAGEPRPEDADLRAFIAEPLEAGWLNYFAPYERVHQSNLDAVTQVSR
jgi:cyclase